MDNYNVKSYGVVTTDGFVSIGAPLKDNYYPTMYQVKQEIAKNNQSTNSTDSNEENTIDELEID